MRKVFHFKMKRIEAFMRDPHKTQKRVLTQLLQSSKHTEWGKKYGYQNIQTEKQFSETVPIQDYDSLKPYINRMMHGEKNVLWKGRIKWFSKSSGTTSDKSKFIPVSNQNLKECHIRGTYDTVSFFYKHRPDALQFERKSLLMGGNLSNFPPFPKTIIGDVSAIMIDKMPSIARPFVTPDFETALLENFEEKIEKMAAITSKDKDLVMIGGVPTWTVVLFRRILEITGAKNMLEVWPNLQGYMHGGVSFEPYRKQFQVFLPSDKITYQEIYNASEGFFAVQSDFSSNDMLLLLDNGVYYEFLPMEEWHKENPKAIPLEEVEIGKNYALIISTSSGLWRYKIGDTVTFTSTAPYKIKITGRTKQFINTFGEEVIVENTDKALTLSCLNMNATVSDYTAAPIYFEGDEKGGHEWLIEFEKTPENINDFAKCLDENLQKLNSDYEAKRFKDMALVQLKLNVLPAGTFNNWLKSKGKLGGQHKVPRLANHRKYVDDILAFIR